MAVIYCEYCENYIDLDWDVEHMEEHQEELNKEAE
jgi:hypothetical protein